MEPGDPEQRSVLAEGRAARERKANQPRLKHPDILVVGKGTRTKALNRGRSVHVGTESSLHEIVCNASQVHSLLVISLALSV